VQLQAGGTPDRFIRLPFLDEGHDSVALPQWQLLQYLAVAAPKLVWDTFGSWLRTIRRGIPPSEFVVANALRQTLPEFLMAPAKSDSLTKFIAERQDTANMRIFRLAS
jgi:hypothetical protein